MRLVIIILLLSSSMFAAVGDNAPQIPSTYVNSHPRLPSPSTVDLNNIFTNVSGSPGSSRFKTAADNFTVGTMGTSTNSIANIRKTITWYMACKQNATACANAYGNTYQATLLAKILRLAHLNGLWGDLAWTAPDGVLTGTGTCSSSGNCALTSASSNFLTACNGGSCANLAMGVNGMTFSTGAVSSTGGGTNNTIALVSVPAGLPPNTGSNLDFGITVRDPSDNGLNGGSTVGQWGYTMLLDWINGDVDSVSKQLLITAIEGWMTQMEANYSGSSPFSDLFYTRSGGSGLMMALAVYPDDPNSIAHLRFWMDVYLNLWSPVFKLYGGQNCVAENDAGTASLTAIGGLSAAQIAANPGCGLYWPEGWNGYQKESMSVLLGPTYLSWATASGQMSPVNGIPKFFSDNGFFKNYMYQLMYKARPDWALEHLNSETHGLFYSVYSGSATGSTQPDTLDVFAAMYPDPTIRGFVRCVNLGCAVPDGFEGAWPWATPDNSNNVATGSPTQATNCSGKLGGPRCNLGLTRDFPMGLVFMRTGWGESDTECWISYQQKYWTHPEDNSGAFGCFSRGALANSHAAVYATGSASEHWQQWGLQGISFNKPVFYDANDRYSAEQVGIFLNTGALVRETVPNAGSGRNVGSSVSNGLSGCGSNPNTLQSYTISPDDVPAWKRNFEFYHTAKKIGYQVGSGNKYTYVAVDFTDDYNNHFSESPYVNPCQYNTANTVNRSLRAQKVVRQFLFIPDGTSAWVVMFDQLVSIPSNFANIVKKNIIHTINQPTVTGGNKWVALRTELATELPFQWTTTWKSQLTNCNPSPCGTNPNQYQYNGKFLGWMTWAGPSSGSTGSVTLVGGPGSEFQITDSAGTTNWNQCMINLCVPANGTGSTVGFLNPVSANAPDEPGSWRIEELTGAGVGANNYEDYFVNVMRFTNNGDTETVVTPPSTSFSGGNFVTTWTVNPGGGNCVYTVTLPKYGIAPVATAVGIPGCAAQF